jgi:hypothetical protein
MCYDCVLLMYGIGKRRGLSALLVSVDSKLMFIIEWTCLKMFEQNTASGIQQMQLGMNFLHIKFLK